MPTLDEVRQQAIALDPRYADLSDGDLLVGVNRKLYPEVHPHTFLQSIEGASGAQATIKNPELRTWYESQVQQPIEGESNLQTHERLHGKMNARHGGRVMAGLRSLFQGATFGYGDEAVAGVTSFLSGRPYEQELLREQARLARGEEDFPAQSTISEIGGAVAMPGAAFKTAKGAIAGGTAGGMFYGSGKADPGERARAAVDEALPSMLFSTAGVAAQRGLGRLFKRANERPTVRILKRAKDEAYRAVDESGFVFSAGDLDDALTRIYKDMDAPTGKYVPGDTRSEQAVKLVERMWGRDNTLSEIDGLRSRLLQRWSRADGAEADTIMDMVGVINDMVAKADGAPELMQTAREAYKVWMRADFLENAFRKARLNTSATGSGGNIYNNYARVFKNILTNEKQSRMFTPEQLAMMEKAISTTVSDDVMRKLGKLSPDGNGLMLALGMIGTAIDPTFLAASGSGAAAKFLSDQKMAGKVDEVVNMVSGGQPVKPTTTPIGVPYGATVAGQNLE